MDPQPARRPVLDAVTRITDMFAWPLKTSHYVELVNPLWSTHKLQAKVVDVWDETKDARTITLQPGLNWRGHRPGQHVRVGVAVGGMHYTRTYTISSAPERNDSCFTITVKAIEGGRVSHHIVRNLKVGDYLPIGLPQGEFYIPDAQPVKPLFITAGSGITPAMSMVRSLIKRERLPDAVHIHYAPHEFDVIFGDELKATSRERALYKLHLIHTHELIDEKGATEKDGQNYFSAAQLDELCPDWRNRECYACGPQALLEAVETHWEEADLTRHLNVERFRASLAEMPDEAVGGLVHFSRSGKKTEIDAETNLLRAAEDIDMNPKHGCRMGICHTCNTTLLSGCVRDLRNGQLINEAGTTVQICVCATAGDCELDL